MTGTLTRWASRDAAMWIGLALVLFWVGVRATTLYSPLPGWDLDPLIVHVPHSGIGPAWSLTLDTLALIGTVLLSAWSAANRLTRDEPRAHLLLMALGVAGAAGVILNGWFVRDGSLYDRTIGATWIAAIAVALSLHAAARDPRVLRSTLGAFLGLAALLALRGMEQVWIEHPATVASYRENRDAILAAQGWSEGSSMARSFERRLMQPEATGWFGLANVYSSIVAAAVIAWIVIAFSLIAGRPARDVGNRPARGTVAVLAAAHMIACSIALWLSGSKGGLGALIIGVAWLALLLLIARWVGRRVRTARASDAAGRDSARAVRHTHAPAAIAAIATLFAVLSGQAVVLIRGIIGERISELSLYFRYFYDAAALRIFASSPFLGVGPDGFKTAYMTAKNPLSPEDVASPHFLLLDWLATLGLFGAAWVVMLALMALRCGSNPIRHAGVHSDHIPTPPTPPLITTRDDPDTDAWPFKLGALIAAAVLVFSLWRAQAGAASAADTLDATGGSVSLPLALVMITGLAAWVSVVWLVTRPSVHDRAFRLAAAAAAVVLLVHSMVEMTGSWQGSVGIVMAMLGVAAARRGSPVHQPSDHPRRATFRSRPLVLMVAALVPWIACAALFAIETRRAWNWEHRLLHASHLAQPVGELTRASRQPGIRPQDLARRLADLTGSPSPGNTQQLADALERFTIDRCTAAAAALSSAGTTYPGVWRTNREASRLLARAASSASALGPSDQAAQLWDRATDAARVPPGRVRDESARLHWRAVLLEARFRATNDEKFLLEAVAVLERAATFADPFGLENVKKLLAVLNLLPHHPARAAWAAEALKRHDLQRLDPDVKGLTPQEQELARRWIADAAPSP